MTDIKPDYYDQLFRRVQAIIEQGNVPDGATIVLHLFKSGTWGRPSSWTVYHLPDDPTPYLRRVQWHSSVDMRQMHEKTQPLEPTLTHRETSLDAEAFAALMAHGRKIRVPLLHNTPQSNFDGTYYGMVIPVQPNSPIQSELRLQWWGHGDASWQAFAGWTERLIAFFEEKF